MKLNAIIVSLIVFAIGGCTKIDNTYKSAKAPEINFRGNAYEYLQSQTGVYDSLLKAISRVPGLEDTLKTGNITLFAANNRSFELAFLNINQARMDSVPQMPLADINSVDVDVLDSVLCKYMIRSKIKSSDLYSSLSDGIDVETIKYGYSMNMKLLFTNANGYVAGGPKLINFSDRNRSIFTRYWITTQTSTIDISADNAVINLLTSGHDFGFGSTFIRAVNKR
ncbi:fasciclin domain-containing protein [Niabella yanshanensis]|uniref:Fasciclin domain-containing protein n=1 Tax=Niabella yanshanensis TaxID=577386 RepID=A0ABZ0W999_9BACT|nr:fasciclin domain-containing protein [Niabella yanshanensis]WQD39860.1 fasciclin domain-containing protein [Niabella yanshanensis]